MTQMQTPNGWREVRLRDACLKTTTTNPTLRPDRTFVYVDVSSVSNESFKIVQTNEVLGADAPSRARKLIRSDDVIFATVRPSLRRVALIPPNLDGEVCSTGYCVVRSDKERLEPTFIYFVLLSDRMTSRVEQLQRGATYPAISDSDLLNELILLPQLREQRAIARALRGVQEAKEARQRELKLERERKAASMKYLFTHGIHGDARKQTEIGEIPESWQVLKFGTLADIQYGYQTSIPSERPLNGVEIISTAEILNEGRLDLTKIRTVEIPKQKIERYSIAAHDILFNWRNAQAHVGKTALVEFSPDKPMIYASFILRIRAIEPAYYRFLHFALSYLRLQRVFFRLSRRAVNQANFNANELANLQIPLPPLDEQYEIVEAMDVFDLKIAALERESSLLEELFRAMLEQLMTGRLSALQLVESKRVELVNSPSHS